MMPEENSSGKPFLLTKKAAPNPAVDLNPVGSAGVSVVAKSVQTVGVAEVNTETKGLTMETVDTPSAEKSYLELVAEANALLARAELKRKEETKGIIAQVCEILTKHNIDLKDVAAVYGRGRVVKKAEKRLPKAGSAAKYRGPNGEEWSRGPGRKPKWVLEVLDSGGDIEKYRIAD